MICLFITAEQAYRIAQACPELKDELSLAIPQEERLPTAMQPALVIWYGRETCGWHRSEEIYDVAYAAQVLDAIRSAHRQSVALALTPSERAQAVGA